jgi:hypothetical protein
MLQCDVIACQVQRERFSPPPAQPLRARHARDGYVRILCYLDQFSRLIIAVLSWVRFPIKRYIGNASPAVQCAVSGRLGD